ncbi:MAG TPA: hypothetical protein VKR52_04685 [Terracidiphilus sp.]|nr:hypothetical protein [Terracidiphilus sp.]
MAQMSESASAAATQTDDAMESVGLTVNQVTGEIQNSLLSQQESFDLLTQVMQTDSEEIQQLILDEGISFQEASAVVEEANAEIASSSEGAAALSKSSFTTIGVAAGIAFAAVSSAVSSAISSAEQWDQTSEIITQELQNIGSSIPTSQVQAYAQQIQSTTLFSQQQALSAEAVVLGFSNLAPKYQELTSLSADLATKIQQFTGSATADLPSAMKILTNALNDPVAGINQLIRQGGVALPAATVTMIENLAKAGDTAGADAVILQALQGQVGGLAQAAANAPGGGLIQLSNQLTALGTTIANSGLLTTLDEIAKDLTPIIQEIGQWTSEHPKLTEAIVAGTVAFTALLAVLAVVGIVVAAIGSTFAAAAVAIAAVVAVIVGVVISNWDLIASHTETVWNGLYTFFVGGWELEINLFKTALDTVMTVWKTAWNDISSFLGNIWATIQNTVKTGVDYVISAINAFINALDAIHISIPSISIPGTKLATPSINLGFSIPDIPMLAAGGFVTQPTLALIGEAGPEAVVPLSQMGGAGTAGQQIVININGGIFPADQSAIKQIGDMLAKSITTQLRVKNYAL